jgi:hypothetical protein
MTLPEQSNIEHDFYGYAGAGPLTVERIQEPDIFGSVLVRVSLGDQGVYLDVARALELARFITECCS